MTMGSAPNQPRTMAKAASEVRSRLVSMRAVGGEDADIALMVLVVMMVLVLVLVVDVLEKWEYGLSLHGLTSDGTDVLDRRKAYSMRLHESLCP